jgi:hypothetical protein
MIIAQPLRVYPSASAIVAEAEKNKNLLLTRKGTLVSVDLIYFYEVRDEI